MNSLLAARREQNFAIAPRYRFTLIAKYPQIEEFVQIASLTC